MAVLVAVYKTVYTKLNMALPIFPNMIPFSVEATLTLALMLVKS